MNARDFSTRFHITATAVNALTQGAPSRGLANEIVSVVKARRDANPDLTWGIGFMEQGDLSEDEVTVVDGVRLFVDAQWRQELCDHELDVIAGKPVVRPRRVT